MLSFFEALNLILDDKAADHDDFRNILISGSIDQKRIVSLAKRQKITNIKFTDANIEFNDLGDFDSAGNLAAVFTNLSDEDIFVIKYNDFQRENIKEVFQYIVQHRKISLKLGEGETERDVEIDLPDFTLMLYAETYQDIDEDVAQLFPLKLIVGDHKISYHYQNNFEGDDNEDRSDDSDDASDHTAEDDNITADLIYKWRDNRREPNVFSDTDIIIQNYNDENILANTRAYIDYLSTYFNLHEDCERDFCEIMVLKDGIYKDILIDVFIEMRGEDEIEEFNENGLSVSELMDYPFYKPDVGLKRKLIFHYLKCYELKLMHPNSYSLHDPEELILMTDKLMAYENFKENSLDAISDLFRNVCLIISNRGD